MPKGSIIVDKNLIDPTPDNFESLEAAAEFWDTHDTTDYLDEFRTVSLETELRARHFEVEIEEDVARLLQQQASSQGVSAGHLASDLLRQHWHFAG